MNRKSLIALALTTAAAGAAFADDITVDATPFISTATRAEVQADLAAYRQAGVNHASNRYNPLAQFHSQLTRAQVTGDYLASRERVAAFTGEDSGAAYLAVRRVQGNADTLAGQAVRAE